MRAGDDDTPDVNTSMRDEGGRNEGGRGSHLAGLSGGSSLGASGSYALAMAPESHSAKISRVSAALSCGLGVFSTLRRRGGGRGGDTSARDAGGGGDGRRVETRDARRDVETVEPLARPHAP